MAIFQKIKDWFEKICYPCCESNECECNTTQNSSPAPEVAVDNVVDTVEETPTQAVETPVKPEPVKTPKKATGSHKKKHAKKPPKPSKRKKK